MTLISEQFLQVLSSKALEKFDKDYASLSVQQKEEILNQTKEQVFAEIEDLIAQSKSLLESESVVGAMIYNSIFSDKRYALSFKVNLNDSSNVSESLFEITQLLARKNSVIPLSGFIVHPNHTFIQKIRQESINSITTNRDTWSLISVSYKGKSLDYLVRSQVKVDAFRILKEFISITDFYTKKGSDESVNLMSEMDKSFELVDISHLSKFMIEQIKKTSSLPEVAETPTHYTIGEVQIPKGSSGEIFTLEKPLLEKSPEPAPEYNTKTISTDFKTRD